MEVEQVQTIFRHFCEFYPRSKIRHSRGGASFQILAKIFTIGYACSSANSFLLQFKIEAFLKVRNNLFKFWPMLKVAFSENPCVFSLVNVLKKLTTFRNTVLVDEVSKSYRYHEEM